MQMLECQLAFGGDINFIQNLYFRLQPPFFQWTPARQPRLSSFSVPFISTFSSAMGMELLKWTLTVTALCGLTKQNLERKAIRIKVHNLPERSGIVQRCGKIGHKKKRDYLSLPTDQVASTSKVTRPDADSSDALSSYYDYVGFRQHMNRLRNLSEYHFSVVASCCRYWKRS